MKLNKVMLLMAGILTVIALGVVGQSHSANLGLLVKNSSSLDAEEQAAYNFATSPSHGFTVTLIDPNAILSNPSILNNVCGLWADNGSVPTGFNQAGVIQPLLNAINSGKGILFGHYGGFIGQYLGLGTGITGSWCPVHADEEYFVEALQSHPIYNGISTWPSPNPPNKPEQLIHRVFTGCKTQGGINLTDAQTYERVTIVDVGWWCCLSYDPNLCQQYNVQCTGSRIVSKSYIAEKQVGQGVAVYPGPAIAFTNGTLGPAGVTMLENALNYICGGQPPQYIRISGLVKDKQGNPIPEATVTLVQDETILYLNTDGNGEFHFNNIPQPISTTMTASKRGYTTYLQNFYFTKDTILYITLTPKKDLSKVVCGWIPGGEGYVKGREWFGQHKDVFTEISPCWYGLNNDTEVGPPPGGNYIVSDPKLIDIYAHPEGILVIPTIGAGSSPTEHPEEITYIETMLQNEELMQTHISNIVETVVLNRYDGIDIDYENFDKEYKEEFNSFIAHLYYSLVTRNKLLTVTVQVNPPLLYELCHYWFDYGKLANNCDELRIMCYDMNRMDQPGGVRPHAPIRRAWNEVDYEIITYESVYSVVRDNLLSDAADLSKIIIGVPTYGYNWKIITPPWLPPTALEPPTAILYSEICGICGSYPCTYDRDYAHGSIPILQYTDCFGGNHVIVYEDSMSLGEKLNFVLDHNITGVCIWRIDNQDDGNYGRLQAFVQGSYFTFNNLIVQTRSPVDLRIITPSGLEISKDTNEVEEAVYSEFDFDYDGGNNDRIIIYNPLDGIFSIWVTPDSSAMPTDTYTLEVIFNGDTTVIAKDVRVEDMPSMGYSFNTLPYSSLSGFVIADLSQGLLGVNVDIYDSAGTLWQSLVTDDSGYYHIDSIPNGNYTATVVTPLGYQADQETKEFTIHHVPVRVDFSLTKLDITPSPRTRAYWAHQLHKALQNKPQDYTKKDFSRFAGLIKVHFNQNQVNPVDFYSVTQPATQQDSLMELKKLLHMCQGEEEPFLKRFAKAQLMALMLNVVSGKISQTEEISEDGRTVSQVITYCDMLVNDEIDCPDSVPGHGSPLCPYIFADFILTFANLGLTVPNDMIPADIIQIAYRIHNQENLPVGFALHQNYPNPFNPACEIAYDLPKDCHVTLSIYNVLGQKVRVLVDENENAGNKSVKWDGRDDRGQEVTSGIYFSRIQAGDFVQSKKMVLMK